MSDLDMLKILKGFDTVEKKSVITESAVNECGMMPQESASNVNISVTGNSMADIMRALANIESGSPTMAMSMDSMEAEEEAFEDWANEPDEEYQDHEYMTKTISGGLNRAKKMYKPAAAGDNPMAVEGVNISPTFIKHLQMKFGDKEQLSRGEMLKVKDLINKSSIEDIKVLMSANIPHVSQMAKLYLRNKTPGGMNKYGEGVVESIKDRLYRALNEKKAKPDFLDMDKDGNKKEPMKKAVADKKVKEAAKPDFLDMDKDGNKKEPMKKAVADKKKAPFKK